MTISRFYRDRAVFDFVRDEVMPALVERARATPNPTIRVWSAGCANGEEPYTLAIMWELGFAEKAAGIRLEILATDIKTSVLQRADRACYPRSSMRDLPEAWREAAFSMDDGAGQVGDVLVLHDRFRSGVTFAQHDMRNDPPTGPFDLILCRYQAFTYFDDAGQRATATTLMRVTEPGAVMVLGSRERLPADEAGVQVWSQRLGVYRRIGDDPGDLKR